MNSDNENDYNNHVSVAPSSLKKGLNDRYFNIRWKDGYNWIREVNDENKA